MLSSRGERPRDVEVLVDGSRRAASPSAASASMSSSRSRAPGEHRLSLRFEPGVAGYAFTFG